MPQLSRHLVLDKQTSSFPMQDHFTTQWNSTTLSSSCEMFASVPPRTRQWPTPTTPTSTARTDRKSTRLNSSHVSISYAVFCLKKKKQKRTHPETDMASRAH